MQRAFTELASYHTYMAEHSVCDCRLCAQQCCYPLCENSRFLAEGIPDVPVGWSGATKLTASSHLAFSALFSLRFREGLFQQVSASSGSRCFCCDYAPSQGSRSLCEPVRITDLFNRGRSQLMVWIFQRKQFDSMYPPYSLFCKRNLDVNQCLVYPTPSLHVTSYTVLSQLNAVQGHTHT